MIDLLILLGFGAVCFASAWFLRGKGEYEKGFGEGARHERQRRRTPKPPERHDTPIAAVLRAPVEAVPLVRGPVSHHVGVARGTAQQRALSTVTAEYTVVSDVLTEPTAIFSTLPPMPQAPVFPPLPWERAQPERQQLAVTS